MAKYYYELDNGQKVESETIPDNAYALAGYNRASDRGKVTVFTAHMLRPLIITETGEQECFPNKAGKTMVDGKWKKS